MNEENNPVKSLKQEFDEFFFNALTKYRNVNEKKPRKKNMSKEKTSLVEQCRKELQSIANEINLPLQDRRVAVEWSKRRGGFSDQIFVEVIAPLYYPAPKYKIVWDKTIGLHSPVLNI